ncbi:MAG: hypothetical protein J0J06_04225 [Sphingomonas sp.]|nr:hypothetical protein [Sphingomonas sp.]MBN8814638.1 hypothetical protein [Sphingomonas sp.]
MYRMSRMMMVLIGVVVLLVGGTILLSTRAHDKQPTRIEKAVSLGNLAG